MYSSGEREGGGTFPLVAVYQLEFSVDIPDKKANWLHRLKNRNISPKRVDYFVDTGPAYAIIQPVKLPQIYWPEQILVKTQAFPHSGAGMKIILAGVVVK